MAIERVVSKYTGVYTDAQYTGRDGEIVIDLSTLQVYVHDGVTPGGIPITGGGGNGIPGGANGTIQWNNSGLFGGNYQLRWDGSNFYAPNANITRVYAGDVRTDALLYANGQPWVFGSTYSNANVAAYLPTYTGNVAAGAVLTNNLLYANGAPWNFPVSYGNSNVADFLASNANLTIRTTAGIVSGTDVVANFFVGNGRFLSGIIASADYSNSNVAAYLPTYTGGLPSLTGAVTTTGNLSGGFVLGNGRFLTGITAVSDYGNSNVAAYLASNSAITITTTGAITTRASVTAGNAVITGSIATNSVTANSNITAAGLVAIGNVSATGITATGNVAGDYILGNGRLLTGIDSISPGGVTNSLQFNDGAGGLGGSSNLTWDGSGLNANAVRTDNLLYANGDPWDFDANFLITSNVTSITAGLRLQVAGPDLTDPNYPQGIWTIYQTAQPTFGITGAVWTVTGTGTKNAYANFINGDVNFSNISLTFATTGSFAVTAGDYILIGSSNIDATTLGISGSVSTVTIGNFSINNQITSIVNISAALTVSGEGQLGPSSAQIFNTQPTAFSISSLNGVWTTTSVPFWDGTNNYTWIYNRTGTVISGNVSAANSVSARANIYVGTATSGSVTGANSLAAGTTQLQANIYGNGLNGYGTSFSNTTGSFNQPSAYYPWFSKIQSGNTPPTFTVSDTRGTANSVLGDVYGNSASVPTDTLWIAISDRLTQPTTFQVFITAFNSWSSPFSAPYGPTATTIAGENYTLYGIDGASAPERIRSTP